RHTRFSRDWSSDVCSSDLAPVVALVTTKPLDSHAMAALPGVQDLDIDGVNVRFRAVDARHVVAELMTLLTALDVGVAELSIRKRSEERRVGKGWRTLG